MHSLFNSNILAKLNGQILPMLHEQPMKYIFFLLLFITGTLKSQPLFVDKPVKDSLETSLISLPGDTNRINTLVVLSNIYTTINPDQAKQYALEGLDLSRKLTYKKGEILSHFSLSFLYNITGEWAKGIDMAFKAMALAQGYDPLFELYAFDMLVLGFQKQGDFKKALEWNRRSVEHIRLNSKFLEIEKWPSYHQIGVNFAALGILDSALLFIKKAREIAKESDVVNFLGISTGAIGNTYSKMKNYDSAIVYLQSARNIMRLANNDFGLQEFNRDLAQTYFEKGQPDSAEQYALMAYTDASKINNPLVVRDASFILSSLYEKSDLTKSYSFLKTYLKIKDSLSTLDKAQQVQQAELNEQKKLADLQTAQLKARNQIKQNALLGSLTTLLLIALILWYNNRRTQKTNELLKKQKQEIEEQRDQLKATQEQLVQSEKMASLGELTAGIAHEIQNPLNFVNNFSEVNTELIDEIMEELRMTSDELRITTQLDQLPFDPKAFGSIVNRLQSDFGTSIIQLLTDIKENEQKINYHGRRADSIVKGMLQHSRKGAGVKEPTDLNVLCDEYLRLAYHGYKAKDKTFNAEFETHFDPNLPKVNVIPQDFGRVILNIINNAFYALSSNELKETSSLTGITEVKPMPKVTVTTKYFNNPGGQMINSISGPSVRIAIADNGPGIPRELQDKIFQPFFTTKPTGSGTGLGLSLAYEIVTNGHGGQLLLESEEGKGTTFIIQLPVDEIK